jgi:hypothetical protein
MKNPRNKSREPKAMSMAFDSSCIAIAFKCIVHGSIDIVSKHMERNVISAAIWRLRDFSGQRGVHKTTSQGYALLLKLN